MSLVRPVRLIGTLTFLMLSITGAAHAGELRPETVWIPMTDYDSSGAAYEFHLEATLYRPSKPEPFPLFNHGSTGGMRRLPTETLRYPSVAQFFVERGFAVMIPMRRGRGASEGEYGELSGCTPVVLSGGVERGIADVEAALTFLRKRSWADPTRLVLGGMSRGGFLSACDYETTTDANAATVSWSMNCAWSSGSSSNAEGVVHFHDDTLDGMTRMRHSFPNQPTQEYSSPIRGRYLGPCDPE